MLSKLLFVLWLCFLWIVYEIYTAPEMDENGRLLPRKHSPLLALVLLFLGIISTLIYINI
jgi:nitric oxide reductase large subunit